MSRTIRVLVAVLVVSLAVGASACADATGPQQQHAACGDGQRDAEGAAWNSGPICK